MARELVVAAAFGTSSAAAAFRVAQTATLVPLNLITSDSLNSAFIPLYSKIHRESRVDAAVFYRSVQIFLAACTATVVVPAIVFADALISVLAPGLSEAASEQAVTLCRIMLFGLPIFVLGAVSSYLCLASGYPSVVSLRATLQNVALLAGAGAAWALNDISMLGWGFLAGCFLYAFASLCMMKHYALVPRTPLWPGNLEFRRALSPFLRVMRGLIFIPILLQINEVAERVIASLLGDEVVAATEYANFVADTMLVLIAVPVGFAALGSVSGAADPIHYAKSVMDKVLPYLLLVALPLSILLSIYATDVVGLIYERGQFDATSKLITSTVLVGFSVGLWAQVLGYVLLKILSATLQTWKLVRANVVALAVGLGVMSLGLLENDPVFLGLGGSAFGVVCVVLAAVELSAHRVVLRWLARFLPAVVAIFAYALSARIAFPSMWVFHIGIALLIWLLALSLLSSTRNVLAHSCRRLVRRGG